MDGIECLNCGHLNLADAIYCEECGVELVRPAPDPLPEPVLEQDEVLASVEDPWVAETQAPPPSQIEPGSQANDLEANDLEANDLSGGDLEEPEELDQGPITFVQPLPPQELPWEDTPDSSFFPEAVSMETEDPDPLAEEPLAQAATEEILSGSDGINLIELETVTEETADHLDPVSEAVDVDPNLEDPVIDPATDPADQPISETMTNIGTDLEPDSPEPEPGGTPDPEAMAAMADFDENPGTVLDMPDEPEPEPVPPEPKPPTAWLVSESGDRFELPILPILYLGKPNDEIPVQVDLSKVTESEIISRVHAVIHRITRDDQPEAFYLEDAGSLNGTILNGEPLQPGTRHRKLLKPGDTITLGRKRQINFRFQVEMEEPETEALSQ